MTSTPIPEGVLTVDDEPMPNSLDRYAIRFDGAWLATVNGERRARLLSSPRPDGATDDEVDTWLTDAMSVIHQHCNSDGSDDDHNDWVTDLANELERVVGPARYPRPPRHDGVPDDAVAEAVRLLEAATPGPWSWSKRSDRLSGGTNGYDDVMTAREYRDGPEIEVSDEDAELIAAAPTVIANLLALLALLGVRVPPYQHTPPEPERDDNKHAIGLDGRCEECDGPAPVSEVRTGPGGRSEDATRYMAGWTPDRALPPHVQTFEEAGRFCEDLDACREFVARWDAEDAAPAETLADIVGDMLWSAANEVQGSNAALLLSGFADRIEAAAGLSVPSEDTER